VQPFGDRVVAAVGALGPICVGIDPSRALLDAWELPDDASGLRVFGGRCVEQLAGAVPVVKPQVAFFERHGAAGMSAFEEVLSDARSAGLVVIADAKRGDVDNTSAAYADAWFRGPFHADAVTATPYVGLAALGPLVEAAQATGGGVLVVCATSNPDGRALQEAVTADGRTVEVALLEGIGEWNRRLGAESASGAPDGEGGSPSATGAVGPVGAVVGATRSSTGLPLSDVGGVILAPGVGAQGATPDDVGRRFGGCRPGTVLPSASRSLLGAGPGRLRDDARRLRDDLAAALR
jgi:orotidine-5'-phosphate decarboxylase